MPTQAIHGKVGAVYCQTADAAVVFTDEATTGNGARTQYQINNTAKRYWKRETDVVVKKNAVVQTSGFSIIYLGGIIVFDAALDPGDTVIVSGAYLTVAEAGGFFEWSLDMNKELEEVSAFDSAGQKEFITGSSSADASAGWFWSNKTYYDRLTENDLAKIFVFYTDEGASKKRYECFGFIKTLAPKVAQDAVIKETVSITTTSKVYYREG